MVEGEPAETARNRIVTGADRAPAGLDSGMLTILLAALIVVGVRVLVAVRAALSRPLRGVAWCALAVAAATAAVAAPGLYDLRKFAAYCAMPAGVVWLGLLALAWTMWERRRRGPALAATALAMLFTVAGNAWIGGAVLESLQRPFERIDPLAEGPFDAVHVLGGGVDVRPDGAGVLADGGDRVLEAVRLIRADRTGVLVTSGPLDRLPGGRVTSYAAATAGIWRSLGVPPERIVVLEGPRTTGEEVSALKRLVAARGWRRVGLLTSGWHLRRALRLCRRVGVEVTALPSDRIVPKPWLARWLVPQGAGFSTVQSGCWEYLGAALGR